MLSKNIRLKIISILALVSIIMVSGMWVFNNVFVVRDIKQITDKLHIFIIIVVSLIFTASVILVIMTKPLVLTLKKIENNISVNYEERIAALKIINQLPIVVIMINVFGFFIGPNAMMITRAITNNQPYFTIMNFLTILYNTTIGLVSALEQISLFNIVLTKAKISLEIHDFNEFDTKGSLHFSLKVKNILLPTALVLMISSMTGVAGWGFYNELSDSDIYSTSSDSKTILSLKDFKNHKQTSYITQMGILWGLLLLIGLFISYSFSREQSEQLNAMKKRMKLLFEGEGDLKQRLPVIYLDEIGHLATYINRFIIFLNDLINKVKKSSNKVLQSSGHIEQSILQIVYSIEKMSDAASKVGQHIESQIDTVERTKTFVSTMLSALNQMSGNIETQTSFINENSTYITQIMQSINSVNKMVGIAQDISGKLVSATKIGEDKIESTITNIKEIKKASNVVEEVVQIISHIAEQTDLLSMNASIEAAHAGDFGRGFGVVADEIRKLAEDSAKSAKKIFDQLKQMANRIDAGVYLSESTGEALKQMANDINKNTEIIRSISEASVEQSTGAKQILESTESFVSAIHGINEETKNQKEKSEGIKKYMEKLVDEAAKINEALSMEAQENKTVITTINQIKDIVKENSQATQMLKEAISRFQI